MNATTESVARAGIGSLSCEFACRRTEASFLQHHLADILRDLRRALLLCVSFCALFALSDVVLLGYGHDAQMLLLARLLVAVAAVAGIWLSHRKAGSVAMARLAATALEVFGMATFLLIVAHRPHEIIMHGMSMAIMLIIVYIFIPNRLLYAMGVALAASAAFLLLAFGVGYAAHGELLTMTLLLVLVNLFGSVAARRHERLQREQFSVRQILTKLSVRDHLTGCYNRRHLDDTLLDAEIARAQRSAGSLTLIMCDIDRFKSINDSRGHHAGDAVLCAFADLLRQSTRDGVDTVVRYGGEEFMLVLPDTPLHGGQELAERLRRGFAAAPTQVQDGAPIAATASFGVVTVDCGAPGQTPSQRALVGAADELMYQAKHGGRNQVRARQLA
ncbi:MAG TPA: GGDEF domain-containing protein [Telluria sp.]|nr:GGDEF domain-containing protein [Telluria sp.]